MTSPEEKIIAELTEGVAGNPDWEKALFLLIIQTNRSMDMTDFKKNVDLMEGMVSPYLDPQFYKDKVKSFDDFREHLIKFKGNVPESVFYTLEWTNLKAIYAAIMKLLFRHRMTPQFNLKEKRVGKKWV